MINRSFFVNGLKQDVAKIRTCCFWIKNGPILKGRNTLRLSAVFKKITPLVITPGHENGQYQLMVSGDLVAATHGLHSTIILSMIINFNMECFFLIFFNLNSLKKIFSQFFNIKFNIY
ncbi:hypothetical protein BpHYR1_040206 [Brachionus plicatilis]|uniref:Uncharacterized protein n=1 Tax=Brachionus plicatilis TaxID=10195 RepID=A0A3M7PY02_BRAPC|nr:hypothetical protein BpHYR1_040206 [Brachionus plicatilis]